MEPTDDKPKPDTMPKLCPDDVAVATLVSGFVVGAGHLVWLDFVQAPPQEDVARVVARLVMHPDLARHLVKELSKLDA